MEHTIEDTQEPSRTSIVVKLRDRYHLRHPRPVLHHYLWFQLYDDEIYRSQKTLYDMTNKNAFARLV